MSHFGEDVTVAARTPRKWLPLCSQIGKFANGRADRSDLIAHLSDHKTIAGGAPAAFNPGTADLEVNTAKVLGPEFDPKWIGDFGVRTVQFDHPVLTGAVLHEAGHARYTLWPLKNLARVHRGGRDEDDERADERTLDERLRDARLAKLVEVFEEPRIERHMAKAFPADVSFLRSSAMKLVVSDNAEAMADKELLPSAPPAGMAPQVPGVFALSITMILTQGRVRGGVLEASDVEAMTEQFLEVYGPDVYAALDEILGTVVRVVAHRDADRHLLDLAKKWLDTLPPDDDEDAAAKAGAALAQMVADGVLEEMEGSVELDAAVEAAVQRRTEERAEAAAAAAAEAVDDQKSRDEEKKVFSRSTADVNDKSYCRPQKERMPTPDEHAAAIELARLLEQARYRERELVVSHAPLPTGRLDVREIIAEEGRRKNAGPWAAEGQPWVRKQWVETDEPTLTIGMLGDVSGSMTEAQEPLAATQFVLTEAAQRINASIAAVYYGNTAWATLRKGERLDRVKPWSADDGTEKFDSAARALDVHLDLTAGRGARLVVICSDLHYTGSEVGALKKWTERWVRSGVGVLVVTYSYPYDLSRRGLSPAIPVINGEHRPVALASLVGAAAVKALASVSRAA